MSDVAPSTLPRAKKDILGVRDLSTVFQSIQILISNLPREYPIISRLFFLTLARSITYLVILRLDLNINCIREVVDYLNMTVRVNYKPTTKKTQQLINSRIEYAMEKLSVM
ncbi:MAG: hypothetical protein MSL49_01915 [Lactobacillus johnsonii]|nr:hypothetical protein [Lactobacillus johnsonii]